VAGFVINWKNYWEHRRQVLAPLVQQQDDVVAIEAAEKKQFTLFLALLKSICDVMVHSNNPGVDLWMRYRGRKLYEGFHCLLGLTSAATVLYNNYPDYSP